MTMMTFLLLFLLLSSAAVVVVPFSLGSSSSLLLPPRRRDSPPHRRACRPTTAGISMTAEPRSTITTTTTTTVPNSLHPSPPPSSSSTSAATTTSSTTTTTGGGMGCRYDVVRVDLEDGRDYPIYVGSGYDEDESGRILRSHVSAKGARVLLITNDRIAPMYLEKYRRLLSSSSSSVEEGGGGGGERTIRVDTLILPDGEENKNLDILTSILDRALELGLDRGCTFVALGGGVIGDMVGFASAIYQRGVDFIQIPTTVMAMVDSSVGGKTGVNHPLGKNMIGSFHQPNCVFIDLDVLDTLPDRELRSGLSEVIKYGLIRDAPFFDWLDANLAALLDRDTDATRYAVRRSCENKAEVVKADEREAGMRATLNLGHTFGHAIENGSGYGTWLHGEAVSIGTAMAATMSEKMGWIDGGLRGRIYDVLERAGLPVRLPVDSPMKVETFEKLMSLDKKVADGRLRLILLKGELGSCVFTGEFDTAALRETIEEFVKEIDDQRVLEK